MAKRRTVYRDSKTGRFVKKSTWTRSRGRGGTRYKRERQIVSRPKPPSRPRQAIPAPAAPPAVFEWIVSFTYTRSGRSFDVIVTSTDETSAVQVARDFIRDDIDAQRIWRNGFRNWDIVPARGNLTKVEAGNAEYRSKSRASRKKRPS